MLWLLDGSRKYELAIVESTDNASLTFLRFMATRVVTMPRLKRERPV